MTWTSSIHFKINKKCVIKIKPKVKKYQNITQLLLKITVWKKILCLYNAYLPLLFTVGFGLQGLHRQTCDFCEQFAGSHQLFARCAYRSKEELGVHILIWLSQLHILEVDAIQEVLPVTFSISWESLRDKIFERKKWVALRECFLPQMASWNSFQFISLTSRHTGFFIFLKYSILFFTQS